MIPVVDLQRVKGAPTPPRSTLQGSCRATLGRCSPALTLQAVGAPLGVRPLVLALLWCRTWCRGSRADPAELGQIEPEPNFSARGGARVSMYGPTPSLEHPLAARKYQTAPAPGSSAGLGRLLHRSLVENLESSARSLGLAPMLALRFDSEPMLLSSATSARNHPKQPQHQMKHVQLRALIAICPADVRATPVADFWDPPGVLETTPGHDSSCVPCVGGACLRGSRAWGHA